MSSRFDYVKYDDQAIKSQDLAKDLCQQLESQILRIGADIPEPARGAIVGRAKATALTKLEECYMWIGKAIRDDQKQRNAQTELQEQRKDG